MRILDSKKAPMISIGEEQIVTRAIMNELAHVTKQCAINVKELSYRLWCRQNIEICSDRLQAVLDNMIIYQRFERYLMQTDDDKYFVGDKDDMLAYAMHLNASAVKLLTLSERMMTEIA